MIPFKKKLAPISSQALSNVRERNPEELASMASAIKTLYQRFSAYVQQEDPNAANSPASENNLRRMEERFQRVYEKLPKLPDPLTENLNQRRHLIELWLGRLCESVLSITFSLFETEVLTQRKTKAYFCENILFNILELVREKNLSVEEIQHINECLKDELLPYFCYKYPMSEQLEVNLELTNKIVEVNSIEDNLNDLVFKSGIRFEYREDGNYNREIMKFINYFIDLPNLVVDKSRENYTMYKQFFDDMEEFFRKIQSEQFTNTMNKYNARNPQDFEIFNKYLNEASHLGDNVVDKQKQKYRQNVKAYTKKLIGRKISENVKPYNQIQIEEKDFQFKSPAIMRIVTKWCEELMENFNTSKNILNREEQFRMKDGSEKILKRKHLYILAELLNREKKNVDEFLKKINKNNYDCQHDFGSKPVPEHLLKYSEEECETGLFAASVITNYQTYLAGFLNTIIHALMKATKDYEEMVKAYEYNPQEYGHKIEEWKDGNMDFGRLVEKAYSYRLASVPVSYISLIPQLITFHVGDVLRCRCISKEKEIIALYSELERISRQPNSIMKIVRIKNRLSLGTNDILINLMYRNKMLIEMQLAISTSRSKFIDFSNKYNHIMYELKRAEFGPISEMCNIWINNDVKSAFYLQQAKNENVRRVQSLEDEDIHQGEKIEFPFRCMNCNYFYTDCDYALVHIQYVSGRKVCSLCRAQRYDYARLKQNFPELPAIEILGMNSKEKYRDFRSRVFPNLSKHSQSLEGEGIIIDLKGYDKKPKVVKIAKLGKKYIVIEVLPDKNIRILKQMQSSEQLDKFKMQYLLFVSPQITQQYFGEFNNEIFKNFGTEYNFPKYLKKCNIKEKSTIVFMNAGLKDENLQKVDLQFPEATKVFLCQNSLNSIDKILQKFHRCEIIDLGENQFTKLGGSLPENKSVDKLKVMYLNYNSISEIEESFVEKISQLEELQLASNKIAQLPKNFSKLKNLRILNLSRNLFETLPNEVMDLTSLEVLNMYSSENLKCKLRSIPEGIGNLQLLKKINLNFNQLRELPGSIGRLQNLQILYIVGNVLETLPEEFGQLSNLKILNLASNNFADIPSQIGHLLHLEILNLEKCSPGRKPNKSLPSSYGNLVNIKMMDISQNSLVFLPENIGKIAMIQTLFIYENELEELPDSIGQLRRLRLLYASNNKFKTLPDSICELQNLEKLTIKENRLVELPARIGNLKKLRHLICFNNLLTELPSSFRELQNLQELQVVPNSIQNLENIVRELKSLNLHSFNQRLQKFGIDSKIQAVNTDRVTSIVMPMRR